MAGLNAPGIVPRGIAVSQRGARTAQRRSAKSLDGPGLLNAVERHALGRRERPDIVPSVCPRLEAGAALALSNATKIPSGRSCRHRSRRHRSCQHLGDGFGGAQAVPSESLFPIRAADRKTKRPAATHRQDKAPGSHPPAAQSRESGFQLDSNLPATGRGVGGLSEKYPQTARRVCRVLPLRSARSKSPAHECVVREFSRAARLPRWVASTFRTTDRQLCTA